MQVDVDDTPAALPVDVGQTPMIQNQGPGSIYLEWSDAVSDQDLEVVSGGTYEFLRDITKPLWAVSDSTSDVRILVVG